MELKKILLTTDFSKFSLTATDYALDRAEHYNATIHLLHVLEKIPPILAMKTFDLSEEKIMESLENEARANLDELISELKKKTSVKIIPVLRKGVAYHEIVEYSQQENIDLIVLATNGHTGFMHTLLGSVAEKVVRYAKCPILVITPKEEEERG